jgi:hypothetical protein
MATTQAVRRDFPASARRRRSRNSALQRAVYDQEADRTVRDVRRAPTLDAIRVRRPASDLVARCLALSSLALVTLIAALIIFH